MESPLDEMDEKIETRGPTGLRPGIIYTLANAGVNAAGIFIPKIAHDSFGADLFTTGLIVSMSNVVGFLSTTIFGRYADVHGLRKVMRLGLVLTSMTILVQILAHDPLTLIGARALIGLCSGMYPAALIAYASISKVPMGRFSSFNALGWALGSILSGVVTLIYPENYTPVFVLGSLLMIASYASSFNLPAIEEKRHKIPLFPKELMLKNWHVYFPYLIRHLGANTVWAIFPLYLTLLGKGMENINFWIGLIYFVNAFSQFIFMPYLDRVKSSRSLIQGGLVCSVLVFLVYAIIPDIYTMVVAQLLLAFSWALLYVGSLRELMDNNVEKATCSGMLSSFITLAAVIGPLLGGFIAGTVAHFYGDFTGYTATLLFAAGASMVSLLLFRTSR